MEEQAAEEEQMAKRQVAARRRAARQRRSRLEAAVREVERLQREKKDDRDRFVARASGTDPEAHMMRNGEGGTVPSYNVQLVTDAAHRSPSRGCSTHRARCAAQHVEAGHGSSGVKNLVARASRSRLSWHGHLGHDGARAGRPCHNGRHARATSPSALFTLQLVDPGTEFGVGRVSTEGILVGFQGLLIFSFAAIEISQLKRRPDFLWVDRGWGFEVKVFVTRCLRGF